jgi:hypothetical protein
MPQRLRLRAPPGYAALQPLDRTRHAGMGLRGDGHAWCAQLNAVYLSLPEFGRAALDYPIAFARLATTGGGEEYQPVAVLGLRSGQNLFVDAGGHWRKGAYVPAYCRRYPFCIAEIPGEDAVAGARRLICVDESGLQAASQRPLFDANGAPTPAWPPVQQLIEQLEAARMQSRVLAKRLDALQLLRPFEALALPRRGAQTRLQGLHRVDEEKLQQLNARDLRALLRKGELRAIYAHLLSLENFARLLDLAAVSETRP